MTSPAPHPARVAGLRLGRRHDDQPWSASATPAISWRTETDEPGWQQGSATVRVEWLDHQVVETFHVDGADSVAVPWPGRPLAPRERVRVEVATRGLDGEVAQAASVLAETGPGAGDWEAEWIRLPDGSAEDRPGQFRRTFDLAARPERARLYVTALGVYDLEVNGRPASTDVLAPGWTSYRDRVTFQTYDVTDLLAAGENTLGVWLAGGWFTERYGFFGRAQRAYEGPASVRVQLEVTDVEGHRTVIGSDPAWSCLPAGPLTSAGIYAGEHFDARRHDAGWSRPGASATGWVPAVVATHPAVGPGLDIVPAEAEPVRRVLEVPARHVLTTPSGKTVVDFGQNLVGRVRLRLEGPAGHTVTLRHAEVLEDGELATRQLRAAVSVDSYTLAGRGVEEWEPRFTFHGFRYLQVDDWPGELDPAAVTAVVCSSDLRRRAWFESSEPLLDRLHENVVWSMRGNFLSIPTDCPQRDERLGWTGDLQVFAGAAATLHDCGAFLSSWLTDLALEQDRLDGVTPLIVPTVMEESSGGVVAAWGDATTVVPWTVYERTGDLALLRQQYASMVAWVETELACADADGLWTRGYQLGDWLDPSAPAHSPRDGRTHPSLVASAYLYRSLDIVARTAAELGDAATSRHYAGLAERTRTSFIDTYVTPRGRMVSEGPTTYSLALVFGIVTDEQMRAALGRRLAEIVREDGYRIGTGFAGTPLVMDALCATGEHHATARLLLQTEAPSWLYPVTVGATTIWERWDALLPDGTVNPHEMTSFNHYAFGAVADWLHRGLAGLAPAAPGYRRIRVEPTVLAGIASARSEQLTPYGRAVVSWAREGDEVTVQATLPPGTTSDVRLPDGTEHQVGAGEHSWRVRHPEPVTVRRLQGLDTDLADLVDDPPALAAVRAALGAHDPGRARAFDGGIRYEAGSTLRTALIFAEPKALDAVTEALAALA